MTEGNISKLKSSPNNKAKVLCVDDDKMIFKFHHAKNDDNNERIFIREIDPTGQWLDDELNLIK